MKKIREKLEEKTRKKYNQKTISNIQSTIIVSDFRLTFEYYLSPAALPCLRIATKSEYNIYNSDNDGNEDEPLADFWV